jgi:hypothetical protein
MDHAAHDALRCSSKLIYHEPLGRSIEYPLLIAGQTHDDRGEDLTLARLDDTWLRRWIQGSESLSVSV